MATAEIITIGTEILLGEIVDINARYIARQLRAHGVDIFRTMSIGDNVDRIARAIQESLARADLVITTGGLGPTVDDPTREAVAKAFQVPVEYQEALWQQVVDRFAGFDRVPTENNRKQAYIPAGATPIENPVGTAPAFIMHQEAPKNGASNSVHGCVISLPGVPREMEYLITHRVLPYLQKHFDLDTVLKVRILRTSGVGESQIDERISDLEALTNPTVGLAAHTGQVDVRIAAKAATLEAAEVLIAPVEAELRDRLGNWIYGADDESLEGVAMRSILARDWQLVALEAGLAGKLIRRFAGLPQGFLRGEVLTVLPTSPEDLLAQTQTYRDTHGTEVGLGVALASEKERQYIYLALVSPSEARKLRLAHAGPPGLAHRRAINYGLDLLRKV